MSSESSAPIHEDHRPPAGRRQAFEEGNAPRLPLIGLRTIIANKLRHVIDGDWRHVTLKTKGWP
jgi:hypothetical protein